MIRLFKTGVVLMTLCAFTGCTTLQALEDPTPARIQQSIERGDNVKVTATNGKTYYLDVTKVEADSFTGANSKGKQYKVPYEAVQSMDIQEFSVLGSLAGATGVLMVIGVVAAAIALHNLDIHFGICE